jgi:hypothetical protein
MDNNNSGYRHLAVLLKLFVKFLQLRRAAGERGIQRKRQVVDCARHPLSCSPLSPSVLLRLSFGLDLRWRKLRSRFGRSRKRWPLVRLCTTLFDAIEQFLAGSIFSEADEIDVSSRME